MTFRYPPGATPLDPDEMDGLKLSHITMRTELDRFEASNIRDAEQWAFGRKHADLLSTDFIRMLHKKMFGMVWKWAGTYRKSEKNIGVISWNISTEMHQLCGNAQAWLEYATYPPDEMAARFHHMLVKIHPFPNGNGRLARIMADLVLVSLDQPRFSWGKDNLSFDTAVRQTYIQALRSADNHDYTPLLDFVRS